MSYSKKTQQWFFLAIASSWWLILGLLPVAVHASSGEVEFEHHVVQYHVVTTDFLSPEVARAYGLSRSRNRALVNIVVMHQPESGTMYPVSAIVQGNAVNLNQQTRPMRFREVRDGEAYYHLAEVPIRRGEVIDFRIQVRTTIESEPLSVQFRQAFIAH